MDEDRKEIVIETVSDLLTDSEGIRMEALIEIVSNIGLT
jgi:hypothetical protein